MPLSLFDGAPITGLLKEYNAQPVIFKMDPFTWYNWHIDKNRSCSINSLLRGEDSKCLYGNRISFDVMEVDELVYSIGDLFALDTTKKHAVLNMNNTRFMFSVSISPPITFSDVLSFCTQFYP